MQGLLPDTRLSHYHIIKKLGEGGMGEVYLAEDIKLNRLVALKFLSEKYTRDKECVRRFHKEAHASSALNHPNILTIFEVEETESHQFLATEFIEGETLRQRIEQTGQMKIGDVLDIGIQIASALAAAHEAGIIHRDIKPENIMIRRDGIVKVLDFGIAKLVETSTLAPPEGVILSRSTHISTRTHPGSIIGTTPYMSPEQARGCPVDERTDIWSLGCVLYEMLMKRTPFTAETTGDMLAAIVDKEPPALKSLITYAFPEDLTHIITRSLSKEPGKRYGTSRELLADLRHLAQRLEFEAQLEHSATPHMMVTGNEAVTIRQDAVSDLQHKINLSKSLSYRRIKILASILVLIIGMVLTYVLLLKQTPVVQQPIKSLAVLPLKSLDAGENYLGLGIADAVIKRVSQTDQLIVSPTSAISRYLYEETDTLTAARRLKVDSALEGIVQRDGKRLRVSVNLLRTRDGVSLWAESFDMAESDIFTIQDKVAQQIATHLRLRLSADQQARLAKHYTSDPVAYEYYIKGINSLDQRGITSEAAPQMEATIALFKKAVETDPNYALAHAQLAYSYAWMAIFIDLDPVWVERAKEETRQAEALDPQIAELHVARSLLLWSIYENFQAEAAIRELLLAQQLNPNIGHDELGIIYWHIGLEEKAERTLQRGLEIDATSEQLQGSLVSLYYETARYDQALDAQQRFTNRPPRLVYYLDKRRLTEARQLLQQTLAENSNDALSRLDEAHFFAVTRDFSRAEAAIPAIIESISKRRRTYHHAAYKIAAIYALAGKQRESVKWLRETATMGFPCFPLFQRDADLDPIRQSPEFIRFMTQMNAQFDKYKREFE